LSTSGSGAASGDSGAGGSATDRPTLASDRTALAWTRSALNMAGSGILIARAAFMANLDVLGVICAIAMAVMSLLTWRHGQVILGHRALAGARSHEQAVALRWLTAGTVLVGAVAVVVTVAL
jgi:uncharacterized membrane protein YidH (DUF202 family)